MSGMDFVALDVETANTARGSVCAIGLVVVEAGQISETHSWLCQPPESLNYFAPFNVALHGITAERVIDEPSFYDQMSRALTVIGDRPVVAHSAAFDVGAIRDACDADDLVWPTLTYGCTLVWSRRELDLISYRLPIVADALGIALDHHHDPAADARACAQILLELANRHGCDTVDDFAATVGTRLGTLAEASWRGCQIKASTDLVAPERNPDADLEHPLNGQVVVFTGGLSSMVRRDAWTLVAHLGGIPEKSVTQRTTRLVIGDGFRGDDPAEFHTGKATRAVAWRKRGRQIEVLTEEDFNALVLDERTSGSPVITRRRRKIEFKSPDPATLDQPGQSHSGYWEWFSRSLKADTRAIGGELCRLCGQPIDASAAWVHRERHVCGSRCNKLLIRRWKRQVETGQLADYAEPPSSAERLARHATREPRHFRTVEDAGYPYEHARFPVVGDVIERHGITTAYLPLNVLPPSQRPDVLVWVMNDCRMSDDQVAVLHNSEHGVWGFWFFEEDGQPRRLSLGRYYFQSREFLEPAHSCPTVIDGLYFGRELISDVDHQGREYRWEAQVFSSRPIVNEWTPARHQLSEKRKAVAKAKAAYRERAKRAGIAVGALPDLDPSEVYTRDGDTCQLCGEPVDPDVPIIDASSALLHYLTPVDEGGPHDMAKVVTAHRRCSRRGRTDVAPRSRMSS